MALIGKKVSSILLNYNSNDDLFSSLKDLLEQNLANHTIFVVDNNSSFESVSELKRYEREFFSESVSGDETQVFKQLETGGKSRVIFIYNNDNVGYSAGNNIGIRLAKHLESDYVFIINPDMRIEEKNYLRRLVEHGEKDTSAAIVTSRIIGIDGENQSPIVGDDFWREFLWPKQLFPRLFKQPVFIEEVSSRTPTYVTKVIGCAMLIKVNFLDQIGLLDETTFLYSEEAILSSQVKALGKKIAFIPYLTAYHMHKKANKDNSSKRMLLMINSRQYYINNYADYNIMQKVLLNFSYTMLKITHTIKKI